MKELADFIKACLSDKGEPSYTRCAGFTTLYFYLLWATYKISGGATIHDIDIPGNLALLLFGLYALNRGASGAVDIFQKGPANGSPTD
jgi:hypothetical protein